MTTLTSREESGEESDPPKDGQLDPGSSLLEIARFVPITVAEYYKASPTLLTPASPKVEELQGACVLFDISGYTSLTAKLSREGELANLGKYLNRCVRCYTVSLPKEKRKKKLGKGANVEFAFTKMLWCHD
jgi:hypothetical protein